MGKSQQGPNELPNPSVVSVAPVTTPTIASGGGTVAATLPAIKGGDVTKKIDASITITAGVTSETVTVTVERDGTPFGEAYPISLIADTDIANISCTWLDTTPGKGKPVYTVRATSSVGGSGTLGVRRATAHNV